MADETINLNIREIIAKYKTNFHFKEGISKNVMLQEYIVPKVRDTSWNFIKQILIGTKKQARITDEDQLCSVPKYVK